MARQSRWWSQRCRSWLKPIQLAALPYRRLAAIRRHANSISEPYETMFPIAMGIAVAAGVVETQEKKPLLGCRACGVGQAARCAVAENLSVFQVNEYSEATGG